MILRYLCFQGSKRSPAIFNDTQVCKQCPAELHDRRDMISHARQLHQDILHSANKLVREEDTHSYINESLFCVISNTRGLSFGQRCHVNIRTVNTRLPVAFDTIDSPTQTDIKTDRRETHRWRECIGGR